MFEGHGSVQSGGGDKGLGAQTAGARPASQSYLMGGWGAVWSTMPPRRSFSHCFLFQVEVWSRQAKKVAAWWSRQDCGGECGWPAATANSPFPIFALSVLLLRILLIAEDSVKLWVQSLGTQMFWWCTPRIPGISRVFQSYMNWNLRTPGSWEGGWDHHLEEKKQEKRHVVRSSFQTH